MVEGSQTHGRTQTHVDAHKCTQMHTDAHRRTQTNADTRRHTQMNADERKTNCVRCVGRRNLKTRPDVRRLFKDFQDILYNWFFSEPTHNFFEHPSNQKSSPEGQTALHSLSNMCPIKRTTRLHILHLELISAG